MRSFLEDWRRQSAEGMILGDPLAVAVAVDSSVVLSAKHARCAMVLHGESSIVSCQHENVPLPDLLLPPQSQ